MACGQEGQTNTGSVKYYLEQAASSTTSNALILEVGGEFKPNFSIEGEGFTSVFERGIQIPFQQRIPLTAETFGEVQIKLTLFQENGKAYLSDTISWKSSGEVPPTPDPYFSEIATADPFVYLVFPNVLLRGRNTKEVWIEGDLLEFPEGSYFNIPNDDQLLVKLSASDGIKTIRVKYRNIFGAHSELVPLQIELKSVGPANCKATPIASKTATGSIRTRIEATNSGTLYYKVTGDVSVEHDYLAFDASVEETIVLRAGEGNKRLTVKIKDAAGNACPDIPLTIQYDKNYVPGKLLFENDLLWVDTPHIVILPQYDQFSGDNIEMFVSGGVVPSASTYQWIPYVDRLPVELTPTNGTRHVLVNFRKAGIPMLEVTNSIFLRPYVLVQGSGPQYNIIPGNILSSNDLTIHGCSQSFENVPYQEMFPCTPVQNGSFTISVDYHLKDGTTLTRSVTQ